MQNAVSAQPCVGKFRISLVLLNFLHCNFRLGKVLMRHPEFEIFLPFSKFKMATFNNGYQADSERSDS